MRTSANNANSNKSGFAVASKGDANEREQLTAYSTKSGSPIASQGDANKREHHK
jgi:hypothetical protein